MTVQEAKAAFKARTPVKHKGIVYDAVSALIYRMNTDGGMYLTLELLDRNSRCVSIVRPEDVEVVEE